MDVCSDCVYSALEWASERNRRLTYCRKHGIMWDSFNPCPIKDCQHWIDDHGDVVMDGDIDDLEYLISESDDKNQAIEQFWIGIRERRGIEE